MNPSGEQYEIGAGSYRAIATQVGGALRLLRHGERDLIKSWDAEQVMPLYRGAVLAPWPNRIADGRYTYDGREQQLPINEVARGTALHGLVAFLEWQPLHHSADTVSLGCRLWPQPGYPNLLDLEVSYTLSDDGLRWSLAATNAGASTAPYGCSIHPYLMAGPGKVDDWTLTLPAERVLEVDAERLLPQATVGLEGGDLDFRSGRTIGGTAIDSAFTGLSGFTAQLRTADGSGVEMGWDAACPWVQVHTADRPDPEFNRVGLALEPMTCPPDAFNSGIDLVHLAPQQRHDVQWRIRLRAVD